MVLRKEFMLLFRYEPNPDYQPSEAEMTEMHQQWGAFIGNIAIQEILISTHQLGFDGIQIASDKSTSSGIHLADNLTVSGNMIIKANTIAEAAEIASGCPILSMGGTVEVRDLIEMN